MAILTSVLHIVLIGLGLASVWYWIAILVCFIFRADITGKLKWWFMVIIPQGILITLALRELRWLP